MALTVLTQGVAFHLPGNPLLITYRGTDPAAGAEISEAVPAGKIWEVQAITFILVTDGTAASRHPVITLDNGADILAKVIQGAGGAQTASTTWRHSFFIGADSVAITSGSAENSTNAAFPKITLGPGYRIRTVSEGIVAGDNYAAPVFCVLEYDLP